MTFFALFVHTLSCSATIVFDIDTVQMHNSTTDTIKDTYYFSKSIQHVWIFFSFAKHKNVCPQCNPKDQFSSLVGGPFNREAFGNQWQVIFPSVVGNFCMVMTSGEAGHCPHLFPIMLRALWSSKSVSPISFICILINYAAVLDEFQPYRKPVLMLNTSTLSWYAYYIKKEIT